MAASVIPFGNEDLRRVVRAAESALHAMPERIRHDEQPLRVREHLVVIDERLTIFRWNQGSPYSHLTVLLATGTLLLGMTIHHTMATSLWRLHWEVTSLDLLQPLENIQVGERMTVEEHELFEIRIRHNPPSERLRIAPVEPVRSVRYLILPGWADHAQRLLAALPSS